MTGMTVGFFLAAALFVALGLVNQRRLYGRLSSRRYRNPEAREPSAAAYAFGRVAAFAVAGLLVFQGCSELEVADRTSWNRSEFRDAVQSAAASLEEEPHLEDPYGDYSLLIESEISDAGEGQGPSYAVDVEAAGGSEDDAYEITARGEDFAFCMRITRAKSDGGGFAAPRADGTSAIVPKYDLTATADEGTC